MPTIWTVDPLRKDAYSNRTRKTPIPLAVREVGSVVAPSDSVMQASVRGEGSGGAARETAPKRKSRKGAGSGGAAKTSAEEDQRGDASNDEAHIKKKAKNIDKYATSESEEDSD